MAMQIPDPRMADSSAKPWTWCTVVLFVLVVGVYFGWQAFEILSGQAPSIRSVTLPSRDWRMPNFVIQAQGYGHAEAKCLRVGWATDHGFNHTEDVAYLKGDANFFIQSNQTQPWFSHDGDKQYNKLRVFAGFRSYDGQTLLNNVLVGENHVATPTNADSMEYILNNTRPIFQLAPVFNNDSEDLQLQLHTHVLQYSKTLGSTELSKANAWEAMMGREGTPHYQTHFFGAENFDFDFDEVTKGAQIGSEDDCDDADNWAFFQINVDNPTVTAERAEGLLTQFGAVLAKIGGWLPIFAAGYYFVFTSKQPVNRVDKRVTWRWAKKPAVTEPVTRSMLDSDSYAAGNVV